MGEASIALVAAVGFPTLAFVLWRFATWAQKNPDHTFDMIDPETDISEAEWSQAIK